MVIGHCGLQRTQMKSCIQLDDKGIAICVVSKKNIFIFMTSSSNFQKCVYAVYYIDCTKEEMFRKFYNNAIK